MPDGNTSFGRL